MKSRKVTLDQVQEAYGKLRQAQIEKEETERRLSVALKEFDILVNRTSQQILAKFVREGEL